jgi:hypothetical protein
MRFVEHGGPNLAKPFSVCRKAQKVSVFDEHYDQLDLP